jgi:TPR repeat protein
MRRAAEQADAPAQLNIGDMYERGEGVTQSLEEAAKWYRLAADQGDSTAQLRLGKMYAAGEGVPREPVQAWLWLDLVASGNETTNPAEVADAIRLRDGVGTRMTAAQLVEARRLVAKWKSEQVAAQPFGLFTR